jgi:hypothetical protein
MSLCDNTLAAIDQVTRGRAVVVKPSGTFGNHLVQRGQYDSDADSRARNLGPKHIRAEIVAYGTRSTIFNLTAVHSFGTAAWGTQSDIYTARAPGAGRISERITIPVVVKLPGIRRRV